jgi:signal transduction histidine kinase
MLADLPPEGSLPAARLAALDPALLLASLPEALLVLRRPAADRPVVEVANPACERLLGLSPAALLGRPAEAVLPPPLAAATLAAWPEAVARGQPLACEAETGPPGGRRSLQALLNPIGAERLLVTLRDITGARRAERETMRSARLATIGAMCAGLAHEASQPLNTAGLWLRRLRAASRLVEGPEQPVLARAAAVVEEQLRRAGELIGRIRSLAGEEPAGGEPFDAAAAAAAALRTAATQYAAEGIGFSLEGESAGLAVRGAPGRLEHAVLLLLANARDAIQERRLADPDAPGRIALRLAREADRVVIELRDSGAGIAAGLGETIFDPFVTTKEPGRGTGLGLSVVAGLARAMGGGVEAWNLPEGGACFRMELAAGPVAARRA